MGFHPGWLDIAASKGLVPPREVPAPALDCSEDELQTAVIALAKSLGWTIFHPYDSRRSKAGYPDLTCWRERIIFIELKTTDGVLSDEQEEVIAGLKRAKGEVYIIRPANWDRLKSILK